MFVYSNRSHISSFIYYCDNFIILIPLNRVKNKSNSFSVRKIRPVTFVELYMLHKVTFQVKCSSMCEKYSGLQAINMFSNLKSTIHNNVYNINTIRKNMTFVQ